MRVPVHAPLATLVLGVLLGCAPGVGPDPTGPGMPFDGGRSGDLPGFDVQPLDAAPGFDIQPLEVRPAPRDVPRADVTSSYDVPPRADAPTCDAGPPCSPRPQGCAAMEVCNDGLDNNCNARVDEDCPCVPGAVQRCFLGPPGRRRVGACTDGNQTCQGAGEFGTWGACMGGISPSGEICDNLDNDCNGCADDGLCCTTPGSCPAPGDPRIPTGTPFGTVTLRGSQFGPGAMRYQWHVVGGPCDQMLFDTSMSVSYALNNPTGMGGTTQDAEGETLTLRPTLSGDYTVTLVITYPGGRTLRCTFIVPVRAAGFRAELCWDTTGRDDVDFWLHDPRNRNDWGPGRGLMPSGDTCAYYNCRNGGFARRIDWGYGPGLPGGACREPAAGLCNSPRLDVDNVASRGVPENINVDRPRAGERFRVAVNYYGGSGMPRPMVNIYCGGQLRATFGGYDTRGGMHIGAAPTPRFMRSGANDRGTLWRVADVVMMSAEACAVRAIHPRGSSGGYCVDTSMDRTFDGPCAVPP